MTDKLIAEVRAVLEAATPGPWERDEDHIRDSDCALVAAVHHHASFNAVQRTGEAYSHADALLIANAPAWLAALCDALEAAKRDEGDTDAELEQIAEQAAQWAETQGKESLVSHYSAVMANWHAALHERDRLRDVLDRIATGNTANPWRAAWAALAATPPTEEPSDGE